VAMTFSTTAVVEQLKGVKAELLVKRGEIDDALRAIDVLIGEGVAPVGQAPVAAAAPMGDELGAKVLQALNAAPLPGSAVATRVKQSPAIVRACLKRLESKRLVHSTGSGPGTRWHLGAKPARSAAPAKEAVR